MDPRRFDSLARSLATPKTRRGLFGSVAALAAGVLGLRGGDAQVSQVYCGNQLCASNPGGCKPGCVCCLYTNPITKTVTNSRCRPPGTCSPGREACPADRPHFDPARGCVQCLDAGHCPAPGAGAVCTSAACVNGACTTTASEDLTPCPGGVCQDGACCNTGPGLPGSEVCDPQFGGTCCVDGAICCGEDGCCTDCFLEQEFGDGLCCPESSLCPPRSPSNPEPPHCCREGSEVCAPDESSVGANCYIPARVCNGRYCGGECCGGTTCCEGNMYCSGGSCVAVPTLPNGCLENTDCGPGLGCVGIVRDEEGEVLAAGTCCPSGRVCGPGQDAVNQPNAICCSAGETCGDGSTYTCCELEGCSPRGGRTRL